MEDARCDCCGEMATLHSFEEGQLCDACAVNDNPPVFDGGIITASDPDWVDGEYVGSPEREPVEGT